MGKTSVKPTSTSIVLYLYDIVPLIGLPSLDLPWVTEGDLDVVFVHNVIYCISETYESDSLAARWNTSYSIQVFLFKSKVRQRVTWLHIDFSEVELRSVSQSHGGGVSPKNQIGELSSCSPLAYCLSFKCLRFDFSLKALVRTSRQRPSRFTMNPTQWVMLSDGCLWKSAPLFVFDNFLWCTDKKWSPKVEFCGYRWFIGLLWPHCFPWNHFYSIEASMRQLRKSHCVSCSITGNLTHVVFVHSVPHPSENVINVRIQMYGESLPSSLHNSSRPDWK